MPECKDCAHWNGCFPNCFTGHCLEKHESRLANQDACNDSFVPKVLPSSKSGRNMGHTKPQAEYAGFRLGFAVRRDGRILPGANHFFAPHHFGAGLDIVFLI